MKKRYDARRGVGVPLNVMTPDTLHGGPTRKGLSIPGQKRSKGSKKR